MLELSYDTTERIAAPIETVWDEIRTVDRLLAYAPEIGSFTAEPDGQRARFMSNMAWGPIDWKAEGTAIILEVTPMERLRWCLEMATLQMRLDLTFHLATGANRETVLRYGGRMFCDHKLVRRLRGMLTDAIEEHVHSTAGRVATLAAQHSLAEQRLRFRAAPGSV